MILELTEKLALAIKELTGAPDWIQLVPHGEVKPKGHTGFIADAESRRMMVDAFAAQNNDLVLDYEHQTLSGSEAPAAGWITELEDRGNGPDGGLWGKVKWNDRAKGYLDAREYRYLSPVILIRKRDMRAVELLSAGLTNTPAIDGMVPVINKAAYAAATEGEDDMPSWLKKLVGLPETATDDEVQAACKKAIEDRDAAVEALKAPAVPGEIVEALGLDKGASVSVCKGTIVALKGNGDQASRVAVLEGEIAALKAGAASGKAADLVEQALKDKKIVPGQRAWATDYATRDAEGFLAFCKAAAPVGYDGELPRGPGKTGASGLTEDEMAVCKRMGVSPEEFQKTKGGDGE